MRPALLALLLAASPASAALTEAQLTAAEKTTFASIRSDAEAVKQFLATREYLRLSQRVVAGKLAAKDLPVMPDEFTERFVSEQENAVVTRAVSMNIAALFGRRAQA